jgi:hypothetical protein
MKKLTWMIAILLAGCGGGGGDVIVAFPGPAPAPDTFPDAFIAEVTRVVAETPDDAEAAIIDSTASATAPEDSDSAAL